MNFQTLALVIAIGLIGPLVALPTGWGLPAVVGEIGAGVAFGRTGANVLHPADATFTFLADVGFALIMFVAGSHVPIRDPRLRTAFGAGVVRAVGVGVVATLAALGLAHAFGTGHVALYAVLMASSSAALVLPIVDALHLSGPSVLQLLPQVAIADTACIVALPLAVDPKHAARAAAGTGILIAAALLVFAVLLRGERSGYRRRLHRLSEQRKFALELRLSLVILCGLAALAVNRHVSIMLAGFSLGIALAAIGEPRRLARQLFAVTDGFFGPLFFVWVGATLDLRQLGPHPKFVWLGVLLGAGAVAAHLLMRFTGQPAAMGILAAAQLGVPVAAFTIGTQQQVLKPGEPSALILGALVTVAAAAVAGAVSRRTLPRSRAPAQGTPSAGRLPDQDAGR